MIQIDDSLVLRYVIPVSFNGCYSSLCQTLTDAKKWQLCKEPLKSPAVFTHLYQSVYGTCSDNSLGSTWHFTGKSLTLHYLENKGAVPSAWQIKEVHLHIFHTNVGLLWYELVPAKKQVLPALESLILLQNRFKDCSHTDPHFECERPRHSAEDETVFDPFDAAEWLGELLRPLGIFRYLNGSCIKNGRSCPAKALIFNYLLLQSNTPLLKHELQTTAFRMANGYTDKYLPSQDALLVGIHPFEDVCIYASRSGCGYYAVVNDGNRGFFTGNFNETIRNEYFFLYILALYQSYSLMNFSLQSAENYPSDPNSYNTVGEIGIRLDQFVAELNTFLMKGMHTSVSSVQHHNEFYNYLKARLMIHEDIESIRIGVDALVELQHIRREHAESQQREAEADRQNRQDRRQNVVLAILSLFSLFAVFKDLDELVQKLFSINFKALWLQICAGSVQVIAEVLAYIVVLTVMITCITVLIINFIPSRKNHNNDQKR